MKWEDYAFIAVFLLFSFSLIVTLDDIGVTYDENGYFSRVLLFTDTSLSMKERLVALNPIEHGSFPILISSIFYVITKNVFEITVALRIGLAILFLIFLMMFYIFLRKEFDALTALLSSIALIGMPQVFFHSHLLAYDLPVMVLFMLSVIFFYEAVKTAKCWAILATSLTLGAMLATKINGYIIFVILPVCYFLFLRRNNIAKSSVVIINYKMPVILVIFLLSCLLFLMISPAIVKNPSLFGEYVSYQGARETPVFLFGEVREQSSLIVIILYVPFTILTTINFLYVGFALFFLIILCNNKSNKKSEFSKYILIIFLMLVIFFSSPFVFKGDGRRHFLSLYPFIAIFAGSGLRILVEVIKASLKSNELRKKSIVIIELAVVMIAIGSSAFTLVYAHPFESSYFNILVGGTKGVTESNMYTTTYWLDEFKYTLDWLNNLPFNTTISALPYYYPYIWYKKTGALREDINLNNENPGYLVIPLRQSHIFFDKNSKKEAWGPFASIRSVYSVKNRQGVELVKIFNITELSEKVEEGTELSRIVNVVY